MTPILKKALSDMDLMLVTLRGGAKRLSPQSVWCFYMEGLAGSPVHSTNQAEQKQMLCAL